MSKQNISPIHYKWIQRWLPGLHIMSILGLAVAQFESFVNYSCGSISHDNSGDWADPPPSLRPRPIQRQLKHCQWASGHPGHDQTSDVKTLIGHQAPDTGLWLADALRAGVSSTHLDNWIGHNCGRGHGPESENHSILCLDSLCHLLSVKYQLLTSPQTSHSKQNSRMMKHNILNILVSNNI